MSRAPLRGLADTLRRSLRDQLACAATLLEAYADSDPTRATIYRSTARDFRAAARLLAPVESTRYPSRK